MQDSKTEKVNALPLEAKVMAFHNKYFLKAAGYEVSYTDEEVIWLENIEECQKTVKIYKNKQYSEQIKTHFNRPGKYPLEVYFKGKKDQPIQLTTEKIYNKLDKKNTGKQFFAPEQSDQTAIDRQFTKYRVIYSEVPFITEQGLKIRKVITACAPNFYSSPKDIEKYLINGKLNVGAYLTACRELAALILMAACANQMDFLDIAEFGLGVYLQAFNNDQEQVNLARKCMYTAFAATAKHLDMPVNWIIYDGITLEDKERATRRADALNGEYQFSDLTFKTGNILNSENSLNNGSDQTIGGQVNCPKPSTTEEQVAQRSLMLQIQTECNPNLYDITGLLDVKKALETIPVDHNWLSLVRKFDSPKNKFEAKFNFFIKASAGKFATNLKGKFTPAPSGDRHLSANRDHKAVVLFLIGVIFITMVVVGAFLTFGGVPAILAAATAIGSLLSGGALAGATAAIVGCTAGLLGLICSSSLFLGACFMAKDSWNLLKLKTPNLQFGCSTTHIDQCLDQIEPGKNLPAEILSLENGLFEIHLNPQDLSSLVKDESLAINTQDPSKDFTQLLFNDLIHTHQLIPNKYNLQYWQSQVSFRMLGGGESYVHEGISYQLPRSICFAIKVFDSKLTSEEKLQKLTQGLHMQSKTQLTTFDRSDRTQALHQDAQALLEQFELCTPIPIV